MANDARHASSIEFGREKYKVMSMSVMPDMHISLKSSAKTVGCSVSHLVRTLIKKHLGLVVNDGTEIPVILKIPQTIKDDPDKLRDWLNAKTEGIVAHFCKNT